MSKFFYFSIGFIFIIMAVLLAQASNAPMKNPKKNTMTEDAVLSTVKLPIDAQAGIFLAAQRLPIYPIRNWQIKNPEIAAKIALVYDVSSREILFEKNGVNETRPIASLTKLVTALVVLDQAKLDDIFIVNKTAVDTPSDMGKLIVGEKLTIESLLYALLIESSNDAAIALAEGVEQKIGPTASSSSGEMRPFVQLMNKKAADLELTKTFFVDPSGLDKKNVSTASELVKIMQAVLKFPILQKITQTPAIDLISVDGRPHHFSSTDQLLGKIPEIVAGKTGYTEEAGNCMILAVKIPKEDGLIITVVMEANNRMAETEMLINWTKKAFLW